MMKKRIIIVDDEPLTRMDLSEILEDAGYSVVGEASDGIDAVELCRKEKPDLIIMDIKMPLLDGLSASKIIQKEELSGAIILLTAYSGKEFIEKATNVGVIGYLVKPIDEKSLLPAVEVALAKGIEFNKIKQDLKETKDKLESRKIVEKAKGILMKKYGLNEDDAYKKIRSLSMNKSCSMKDIAEMVILSDEE
ncbi:response regulator receiver and ANTAR domain protein [Hathewaya proteolytica DSM 3090]|uniref:Stage 0 sporulation protein A homolog n=2 Tax=Hathewaya proteolytica TaxID=29365 RepID=A0A1M6KB95_9CLOT|nr:response regulator receiver and ANTAR domain protein [Hathewaya proteolytica DSM 3090]